MDGQPGPEPLSEQEMNPPEDHKNDKEMNDEEAAQEKKEIQEYNKAMDKYKMTITNLMENIPSSPALNIFGKTLFETLQKEANTEEHQAVNEKMSQGNTGN